MVTPDLNRPEQFRCADHSSHITAPSDCADCKRERRLVQLERRIEGLETENEQLREAIQKLLAGTLDTREKLVALAAAMEDSG